MKKRCMRLLGPYAVVLSCYDTTENFEPLTPWMPLFGMGDVDFTMDIRNLVGLFTAKPGYEVANVRTDRPDTPTGASSFITTETIEHVRESLTSVEGTEFWVRFGALYKNSSGNGLGRAEVQVNVVTRSEGEVVGARTLQLNPTTNSTDVSYFTLTGWEPTLDLAKILAAFIIMNESGNLQYQLAIRTATDKAAPNAWAVIEGGYETPASANDTHLTAEIDPDTVLGTGSKTTENMWYQLGVAVKGNTGRCTMQAIAAAKRS